MGTAQRSNRPSVRIGVIGGDAVEGWSGAIPSGEGFTIDSRGAELRIVGANGRGVLNGVYDYLESDLGVRWYMPGDMGEDVPSRTEVLVAARVANTRAVILRRRRIHLGGRSRRRRLGDAVCARGSGR